MGNSIVAKNRTSGFGKRPSQGATAGQRRDTGNRRKSYMDAETNLVMRIQL